MEIQPNRMRVKVEFNELAKSVSANVVIEQEGDNLDITKIREEAQRQMDLALSYSANKTMAKNR